MPTLDPNFRAIWPGTHASIPARWEEDTDWTDRYLKGSLAGFTGAANGGSADHGHGGSTVHGHTGVAHVHVVTGAAATGGVAITIQSVGGFPLPILGQVTTTHTHDGATDSATEPFTNSSFAINVTTSHPEHVKIIVIRPKTSGTVAVGIPVGGMCVSDETDGTDEPITDFKKTDGAGGRVTINGKFLKAVDNDGENSDLSGFGSDQHAHGQIHNHNSGGAHAHGSMVLATTGTTKHRSTGPLIRTVWPEGHHLMAGASTAPGTGTDNNSDDTDQDPGNSEPPHSTMLGLVNTFGVELLEPGVILPYIGSIAVSTPTDWDLADGSPGTPDIDGQYLKITTVDGEVGDLAGNVNHTHDLLHRHQERFSHTHVAVPSFGSTTQYAAALTASVMRVNSPAAEHDHVWTISDEQPFTTNTLVVTSSTNGAQLFRTVAWLKYSGVRVEGGGHAGPLINGPTVASKFQGLVAA